MKPFDQFLYYLALLVINIAAIVVASVIIQSDIDLVWKILLGLLLLGFYDQETNSFSRIKLWKARKEIEEKENRESERIEPYFESNAPSIAEILENKNSWGKRE